MAKYSVDGSELTSIANAIREKGETSAGLSFPDGFIEAVGNISTNPATLITKTITANGTYSAVDDSADGYSQVNVNVTLNPSNYITGTFTGTTAGEIMTVTVPYTGSGYPIAIIIYPSEGTYNTDGSFYATIDYRAVILYCAVKNVLTTAPSYNAGSNDSAMVAVVNKNSSSSATTTTSNRNNSCKIYTSGSASPYSADMLKFNSATAISVIMSNSAYGFAPNVEYTYHIVYSS